MPKLLSSRKMIRPSHANGGAYGQSDKNMDLALKDGPSLLAFHLMPSSDQKGKISGSSHPFGMSAFKANDR